MPFSSFCGLLTLQVGVAVLSGVFFTLAAVVLVANIFNYRLGDHDWPTNLILVIVFVVGLLAISFLMFGTSYTESRSIAIAAFILVIIVTCYWIILCCFTFVSVTNHVRAICMVGGYPCVYQRCPESFWIADLRYRRYIYEYNDYNGSHSYDVSLYRDVPDYKDDYYNDNIVRGDKVYNTDHDESKSRLYYNFAFAGALILFFVNLIFLIYSALVLWSWASELDWVDYYVEDEPVYM